MKTLIKSLFCTFISLALMGVSTLAVAHTTLDIINNSKDASSVWINPASSTGGDYTFSGPTGNQLSYSKLGSSLTVQVGVNYSTNIAKGPCNSIVTLTLSPDSTNSKLIDMVIATNGSPCQAQPTAPYYGKTVLGALSGNATDGYTLTLTDQ